ncbi:glycosyltransferase family 4 protein [Pedococcus sp. NPDC057267]|uniref:glycosyltransferase family 4 protein n=1 Tax=Pedococcus sp. NPDC057267 TaxID=3346077 RepID=UPI00363FB8C3
MAETRGGPLTEKAQIRLCVVLPHVAQYFSPLFDALAKDPRIALQVVYASKAGLRPMFDAGFGREVAWDVPLVDGHPHVFLDDSSDSRGRVPLRSLPRLLSSVREADVVVIHGHASLLAWAAAVAAWLCKVPYLTRSDATQRTVRPHWDPRTLLAKWFARRSNGALASSERNAALQRELGSTYTPLVPLTVDVSRFAREARSVTRLEARRRLGLPDGPVVGYVGKFVAHKRIMDLVEAVHLMHPRPHLLFAGDGPLRGSLEQRADGEEGITILGFQNQLSMPAVLAALDVLVLPSDYEPWGLIVHEALSCGVVPVVSDMVGCGPEIVEGRGQIYPVADVHALAAAVSRALATDGEAFGEHVQAFIKQYSIEQTAQQYIDAVSAVAP